MKGRNMSEKDHKVKKPKKESSIELKQQLAELTEDLQRTRADFENYRKRSEDERQQAMQTGQVRSILKLLPVIDNIERAITHVPDELKDNKWALGIIGLSKNLDKSLLALDLKRIKVQPGDIFNPDLHDAVQFDEDADGETEVIAEELQTGYLLNDAPIRHTMVKVTKK